MVNPAEIIGTWTTTALQPDPLFGDAVPVGAVDLSFAPDGTFDEIFHLTSGDSESVGHYLFGGSILQFTVDDYRPGFLPEPLAFHTVQAAPVDFSPSGLQMAIGDELWNFVSPDLLTPDLFPGLASAPCASLDQWGTMARSASVATAGGAFAQTMATDSPLTQSSHLTTLSPEAAFRS